MNLLKIKRISILAVVVMLALSASLFVACDQTVKTVTAQTDCWNDYLPNVASSTRYSVDADNVAKIESNANYSSTELSAQSGDRFMSSFAVQGSGTFGVLFADADYKVVSTVCVGKSALYDFNNVQLTVPEGAVYVLINSRSPKQITVKKYEKKTVEINVEDMLSSTLKLACLNCGEFDYGDGTTSSQTYQAAWEKMVKETACGLFMFEDAVDAYSADVAANDIFSANSQTINYVGGISSYLRAASNFVPETMAIVPFDCSIVGSSNVSARFYALRLTYHVGGKQVAVYGLHLVAEGHISSVHAEGEYSLSQKLRQTQFKQLIADAKNYDESIFLGDFNSQQADEYTIFATNGYTVCNCSEKYGTSATLRDIPADNIIVSGGITVDSFEIYGKDVYYLNTDHLPLCATLTFAK